MKKQSVWSLVLSITLLLSLTNAISEQTDVSHNSSNVYVEGNYGNIYFHYDPFCAIANQWSLPMRQIEKTLLNDETYSNLRPCVYCASSENEEYYRFARHNLAPKELEEQQWYDEINLKLLNRDSFTFADWAELFPETYTIPSEDDISSEEAIEIAFGEVSRLYGVSIEDISLYNVTIMCVPNYGLGERDDENGYIIQFGNDIYPLMYAIEIYAFTGEVKHVECFIGDGNF